MDNRELLRVLREKGVGTLHHANTVATSLTFLREGALLSRKWVEDRGLVQTSQYTDATDKKYGIWNDIFLDGVDIHYRSRQRNRYGPVLFELDLASVLEGRTTQGVIRISRDNPSNWTDGQSDEDRYLLSTEAVRKEYNYGDFGKSLMLRLDSGRLPLGPHLRRIVVDDPRQKLNGKDAFAEATQELATAAKRSGIRVEVAKYQCRVGCRCEDGYRGLGSNLAKQFGAKG